KGEITIGNDFTVVEEITTEAKTHICLRQQLPVPTQTHAGNGKILLGKPGTACVRNSVAVNADITAADMSRCIVDITGCGIESAARYNIPGVIVEIADIHTDIAGCYCSLIDKLPIYR